MMQGFEDIYYDYIVDDNSISII